MMCDKNIILIMLDIAMGVGGGTAGTLHLSRLYPELKHANGSNVLMVFTLQ
jgi:hypothetical protein